jgi:hypothetical protein
MAALYIYEQRLPGSGPSLLQRGIIGLVRLGSPESAGILPHENVMPGLVAGRRELMAATQANLEPIFLIYDGGQYPDATDTEAMPMATEVMSRTSGRHWWRSSPRMASPTGCGGWAIPASRPRSPPTCPAAGR